MLYTEGDIPLPQRNTPLLRSVPLTLEKENKHESYGQFVVKERRGTETVPQELL